LRTRIFLVVLIPAYLVLLMRPRPGVSGLPPDAPAKPVDFDRDIRPILADNCFACHGPDEKQRMANLRLDQKEELFADRGGYRIVTPGKPAESKIYQKVSSSDPSVRMPPFYSERKLTPAQIELIKRWIDEGAKYEQHWSFVAPQRPLVPAARPVNGVKWPRNPIDNFVLARLEREGLKPSPEADKATLLRRVTFDLTGLPPTPSELDSFLADKSPDAYEKRVDQLLKSPHYGEKMAMAWLDLARYSDTHGYHIDSLRQMWRWRDWVIDAYNRNLPYDEFTIEQLAGDLLPNATVEQKIATGFSRDHMINFEGGAIPQEYHVEYIVDRVSTTGTTWLGLTVGCARCHDHKYDPIKQKDFYRMFAFFNTVPERGLDGQTGNAAPVLELPAPEQQQEIEQLNRQIAETLAAIPEKDMVAQENQWRAAVSGVGSRESGVAEGTGFGVRVSGFAEESKPNSASSPRAPNPEPRTANVESRTANPVSSATPESRLPTPDSGLAAHYAFEGNLADTSGHGLDAKATRGDVGYVDGAIGKAADFSGETQVDFPVGDFDRPSSASPVPDFESRLPEKAPASPSQLANLEPRTPSSESRAPSPESRPFALAFWAQPDGTKGLELIQKRDPSPNWRGYEIAIDDPTFDGPQRPRFTLIVRVASRWPGDAIEVKTKERVRFERSRHFLLNYDGSGRASGVSLYLDGKPLPTEAVKDNLSGSFRGSFRTGAALSVGDKKIGRPFKGQIDDLRIYDRALTADEATNLAVELPARALLAELAGKPVEKIESLEPEKPPEEADIGMTDKAQTKEQKEADRLKSHQARLSEYYLTVAAPEPYRKLYAQLKDLREKKNKLQQSIPTAMVMAEMKKPRDTFVLGRGQYDNPGEKVTPGVPGFLPPMPPGLPPNRLGLAKWLVDPGNPLTARVAVNRAWQSAFGTGIVKTAEDFGTQGEPPSHPELLDWLATEFVRTGWDVKRLERLIVTSATYRQSSRATPEMAESDPENRLLARGPRFRLPAEEIRDNALAASGLLDDKIGGPSVYPYQPKGLWEEMAFGEGFTAQTYVQSTGADLYRRSMYTIWKRTVPPPSLTTFDAPDREKCTARRSRTNTPLQALVLLNDPTYVEASRALAQRALLEAGKDPTKRIDYVFRLATARNPQPQERQVLIAIAKQELTEYGHDKASALKLLAVGDSKYNAKLDPVELAAWTTVASTVLNLDETITKE